MSVRGAHGCAFHIAEYPTLRILLQKYDYAIVFLKLTDYLTAMKSASFSILSRFKLNEG